MKTTDPNFQTNYLGNKDSNSSPVCMESLGVYTEDRAQFRNSGSHNRKEQAGRNSLNIKSSLHTNATLWLRESQSTLFHHMNSETLVSPDGGRRSSDFWESCYSIIQSLVWTAECRLTVRCRPVHMQLSSLPWEQRLGPWEPSGMNQPCWWPQQRAGECGSQTQGA